MTEEIRRKLVMDAEFYVASHRPHKMFTVDDVNNIAVGFAEKWITKVTKELKTQIEKMKCCHNCRKFHNLSYDCTCAEVCNEWEIKEND